MNFRYIKFCYFSELFLIILLFECHLINVVTPFTSITREQFNSINENNYLNNNNNNKNNNLSSYQKIYNESKNINSNNNNNNNNGCMSNRLAFYKVILHTYWSRDLFPKHYPDWRPSAQWTKTLGKSHNSNFSLFHIGQQASDGVKEFVETGQTNILENTQPYYTIPSDTPSSSSASTSSSNSHSFSSSASLSHSSSETPSSLTLASIKQLQNEGGILDEFSISPILTGEGQSEAKFFADDNHSLVSLMTRIVPSPDWFIGVDSFQLCIGGTWIDTVTLEMDPLDAGTDNGFTFTAPNWPTNPQGVIYRITSKYPSHPAGSFFYPKNKRLPPIATFQFIKVKEYELSEEFNFKTDEHNYETIRTQTHLESEHNHVEINNELSATIEKERQNEIITDHPISYTKKDRIRARMLAKINPSKNSSTSTTINDNKIYVLKNDKNAILNSIAMNYKNNENIYKIHKNNKKRVKHKSKGDCRVGHWSNWGPCSKTCGIGEMRRYRKVLKYAKRGGRPCPPLQESKWCGTGKYCNTEWIKTEYTFDDNRPTNITSFNWSYT